MRIGNSLRWNSAAAILAACLLVGALTASAPGQSAPAGDGAGVRTWTSDIVDTADKELAGPAAGISIVGARNGVFSGKVVVSSPAAIRGLKAAASDLGMGPASLGRAAWTIPVSAIQVRFGVPWGGIVPIRGADILLESAPAELPAGRAVPVWVTVKVPKDAPAGAYAGELKIQAASGKPIALPLKLDVQDWTLPDCRDYRTWVEIIQSPDTLAVECNVPLWSQKHWDLIARSMGLLGEMGSRALHVPLIAQTTLGNEQSMVRWIKKGPDQVEFDFSIMDKYLDLAEKHMGKPKVICFNVWDMYMMRPGCPGRQANLQAGLSTAEAGPLVTMLDASGKAQNVVLPDYPFHEGVTVWAERIRGDKLEQHFQKVLEDMPKRLVDFKELGKGTVTIDGQEARWVHYSCSRGPFPMKTAAYMATKGALVHVVTGLARLEKFDQYKAAFEGIAKSFKYQERDFTVDPPKDWEFLKSKDIGWRVGLAAYAWAPAEAGDKDPVREAWRKLFDQIRERLKKRGLEGTMHLSTLCSDYWASKPQVEFMKETSGNVPWFSVGHYVRKNEALYGVGEYGYQGGFFAASFGAASQHGWKVAPLHAFFIRAYPDGCPMVTWRLIAERCITGNMRGVSRLGGDMWLAIRDKDGNRAERLTARYPAAKNWWDMAPNSTLLAPGPEGAVGTARLENFREGVQECEAVILLESALLDKELKARLGADLAGRCEALLKERCDVLWKTLNDPRSAVAWRAPMGHDWFLSSGWQERSRRLYSLAGEAARKLEAK